MVLVVVVIAVSSRTAVVLVLIVGIGTPVAVALPLFISCLVPFVEATGLSVGSIVAVLLVALIVLWIVAHNGVICK